MSHLELPKSSLDDLKPFHGHQPGTNPDDITRNYQPKPINPDQKAAVAKDVALLRTASVMVDGEFEL